MPTRPVAPTTPTRIAGTHDARLELERGVQRAHRALDVVLVHDARDADRRRRDHLDVDALGGEGLEHLRRDTGVGLHARADERDAADGVVEVGTAGVDLDDDLVDDLHRAGELVAGHGERDVGVAGGRDVLHDHVDVDVLVGERAEQPGGDAGPVGHAEDRDLRLRDVVGDARDDRRFHAWLLLVAPTCPVSHVKLDRTCTGTP